MPSLTTTISVALTAVHENTVVANVGTTKLSASKTISDSLANGTGLDQADQMYMTSGTVAAGTPVDLDLSGSVTNAFGTTVAFARLKGIIIHNKTTTAGAILEVGAGSNPITSLWLASGDGVKVGPDGMLALWNPSAAGYAVTATTADILRLVSASGTISYEIYLIGATA